MTTLASRRRWLITALAIGSLQSALPLCSWAAEPWPTKPIRLIVPFPPGGPTDVIGRSLAKVLSDRLGQPVVVENKAGAGGNIGTDAAAKSLPDGYTLVLSAVSSLAIAPALFPKLPYNVATDFTPITLVAIGKGAIVAHPSAPFSDLKGMVDYARANPGKLAYATSGAGTANHLAAEYLQSIAQIKLTHVPYKGTAPATQDLLAGVVPMSFESSLTSAAVNVQSGKLKGIAITAATRSSLLPNVPTVAESGYPGFDVPTWFGLVGPAGLPKDVVSTLNKAAVEGLKAADVVERFAKIGAEPATTSPERFADYIRSENERWSKVVRDADIKME